MLNGFQIVDADAHVFEPNDMWGKYLEPAFKSFALSPDLKIKGESIYQKMTERVAVKEAKRIGRSHPASVLNRFNAESQVRAMKLMGIDIAFNYPSYALWILAIDTIAPQLAGAFTRAYNNWLQDFCSYDPQILKGVGAINFHDPEQMVSELQRIASFGWKAVFMLPNPVKGRLLSDLAYEPFWTECEQLGIAVGLHTAAHARLATAGAERFNTRFALHACAHPIEQMMALLALIEGGVLERHPKLKIGFLESGCGWLPYWLWRLDEEYENLHWEVNDNVKMKPSEYFRRQCVIEIEPSEPYIPEIIRYIGSDNLIFGSDYPHVDHKPDIVERAVALQEQLPQETVQKILWDNSVRFYGLE
ncbi:amidohydrolase family protein [Oscillatoria sp. FACHB-1406]|uniref:amidohydrolase family protein n=1 Tax=Oscillatoria sp. FACHB-1406 TaxID=2692846 RepID=UPI001687CC8C|nr:amidohydrolase family protein [Oscillatoria sp. FACHB-1406]MBD2579323.1 amidohydrolase [Oscillatoria sp. FACHB-1406]